MGFRERMYRFMAGRNGMDQLARFESKVVLAILIVLIFLQWPALYGVALALMIHLYFRILSKNRSKRYQENQRFVETAYRFSVWKGKKKEQWKQRKIYRFYRCPKCRQRVRVPKGRGKICITCPKCRTEFVKKS